MAKDGVVDTDRAQEIEREVAARRERGELGSRESAPPPFGERDR